ncbi:hypothetical protein CWI39_3788p0010, partial [Hamiltosporidium magnivora]
TNTSSITNNTNNISTNNTNNTNTHTTNTTNTTNTTIIMLSILNRLISHKGFNQVESFIEEHKSNFFTFKVLTLKEIKRKVINNEYDISDMSRDSNPLTNNPPTTNPLTNNNNTNNNNNITSAYLNMSSYNKDSIGLPFTFLFNEYSVFMREIEEYFIYAMTFMQYNSIIYNLCKSMKNIYYKDIYMLIPIYKYKVLEIKGIYNKCISFINKLKGNKEIGLFIDKLEYKKYGWLKYGDMFKEMWIELVVERLKGNFYFCFEVFVEDLYKVFVNCCYFNEKNCSIWSVAVSMRREVYEWVKSVYRDMLEWGDSVGGMLDRNKEEGDNYSNKEEGDNYSSRVEGV